MTDFLADVEGLDPGDIVHLYDLDLNPIGHNEHIYWTPSRQDGNSLWWKTKEYLSRPIMASGFKKSAVDKPAEPVLSVSNIDKGGYALLEEYDELLGAVLTRWTTFVHYLDKNLDGTVNPNANSSAAYLPEIWEVEQKVHGDPTVIQWRLTSPLDFRGKQLPNRRAYKDICTRHYRAWNGSSFDYDSVNACPYSGSNYFKRDGTSTASAAEDDCTLDMAGCKLRFPNQSLPIWAFPGLRKYG